MFAMDLGYSQFIKRLQDKAIDNGKLVIKADKWFASSKICSNCGYVYKDLKLSDKEWDCPICVSHHLRDMNAGQNLKEYGLSVILDSGREPTSVPLEMSASAESEKEEFQPLFGG